MGQQYIPVGVIVLALLLSKVTIDGLTSESILQNPSTLAASIERGKKVYTDRCLTCHQVDGLGVPDMNPPLAKTKWVLGDKTQLIQIILKGQSAGAVQIDGDTYHNVMPPLVDLSDQQIADVLTYVRNSFGNKASMVKETEVRSVRAKIK